MTRLTVSTIFCISILIVTGIAMPSCRPPYLTFQRGVRYATHSMRLFLPTAVFAFALFLSGCFHVPNAPVKQTLNIGNTTSTFIDTVDWNTYVNYSNGFSFKYPREWSYLTESLNNSVSFISMGKNGKDKRMSLIIQEFGNAPDDAAEWGPEFGGEYSKGNLKELKTYIKDNPESKNVNGFIMLNGVARYPDSGDIVNFVKFFISYFTTSFFN